MIPPIFISEDSVCYKDVYVVWIDLTLSNILHESYIWSETLALCFMLLLWIWIMGVFGNDRISSEGSICWNLLSVSLRKWKPKLYCAGFRFKDYKSMGQCLLNILRIWQMFYQNQIMIGKCSIKSNSSWITICHNKLWYSVFLQ